MRKHPFEGERSEPEKLNRPVFARVCARMRREMARNALFMGAFGRSDWKSDGGTTVPPILRQNVRRDVARLRKVTS